MMILRALLFTLSSCLVVHSEYECNIMKDKRGALYHPTATSPQNEPHSYRSTTGGSTDKEGSAELRDALLAGLTRLPMNSGAAPGSLVALGDNIEVIMTDVDRWGIVMVAGTFGQGRVIAFPHSLFIAWFKTAEADMPSENKVLRDNCYKWVTNGGYDSDWNIVEWGDRENLATADVSNTLALFKGSGSKDDPVYATDFVNRGGPLIMAVTSWSETGKDDSHKMYFQKLALSFGFFFSNDLSSSHASIANNKAYDAHFGRLMDKMLNKLDEVSDEEWKFAAESVEALGRSGVGAVHKLYDIHSALYKVLANDLTFPVKDKKLRNYLFYMDETYKYSNISYGKAPSVYVFPFDFETKPPIVNSPEKTLQSRRWMYHSTGYYLPAGCQLEISGSGLKDWKVRIGAAGDSLWQHDELKRWPHVMVEKPLSDRGGDIYSAFGGPIYLKSPGGQHTISYKLEGVVESPQFNGSDPESKANWKVNRDKPGLWTDFFSDKIMLTLPSQSVRHLEDPSDMMTFWTTVCQDFEDFKSAGEIPYMWFAPDLQPSHGDLHAGTPIVSHLDRTNPHDVKYFMLDRIYKDYKVNCHGSWGAYHEMGHNLQESAWNFQGTTEVTNNIFSLYGYTKYSGVAPWDNCWLDVASAKGWRNYLDGGAKFDSVGGMRDAGAQLVIFAQLARDFGYDAYTEVFKLFAAGKQPSNNQEKIDLWVKYMSEASGNNTAPIFDFWGMPVSKDVWESQASLPVYQPDDLVTQAYPDRMAASVAKAGTYQ